MNIKHKKLAITLGVIFSVFFIMIASFFVYASIYYVAEDVEEYITTSETVNVKKTGSYIEYKIIDENVDVSTGIIIYPGAQVDYLAYSPLAYKLASDGYYVCIVNFPFKFAFFNVNAADNVIERNSEIDSWYLMGHSLGGAMGASYISKNVSKFDGLILLASYSTSDLSNSGLKVLSIYGSNDGVINRGNYEKYLSNLPSDKTEFVIEGGNHAYFASYGEQDKDGASTITREEQINITINQIKLLINK